MHGMRKEKVALNFFSKSVPMIVGIINSDGGVVGVGKGVGTFQLERADSAMKKVH